MIRRTMMTMKVPRVQGKKALSKIAEILRTKDSFFLASHVFPDGDNIGCMITMKYLLDQLGKKSYLYCESVIPKNYQWLEGSELFNMELPDCECSEFDVIITLDSADAGRVGKKFTEWCSCKENLIINIDHHITNTNFGDINWISDLYAATGEQIYELVKHMGVEITIPMAIALYTAIVTDSGRFSYPNTTEQTLRYAADLVEAGANPNIVYRKIYGNRSYAALKLESLALSTLEFIPEWELAYMYVTSEMYEEAGADIEESEGIIEHIGLFGESIKNILFLKQIAPNEVKASVRTKGIWDASKVCLLFDGGGHTNAGGYSLFVDSIDEAIRISLDKITDAAKSGTIQTDTEW